MKSTTSAPLFLPILLLIGCHTVPQPPIGKAGPPGWLIQGSGAFMVLAPDGSEVPDSELFVGIGMVSGLSGDGARARATVRARKDLKKFLEIFINPWVRAYTQHGNTSDAEEDFRPAFYLAVEEWLELAVKQAKVKWQYQDEDRTLYLGLTCPLATLLGQLDQVATMPQKFSGFVKHEAARVHLELRQEQKRTQERDQRQEQHKGATK